MTETVTPRAQATPNSPPVAADSTAPARPAPPRRKRWFWRILLASIAVWLGLVTAAELIWPDWVEKRLSQELSQRLGVTISLDKVTTDALDGVLHLHGLQISDRGKPLAGFDEMQLDYSWLSLFSPVALIEDATLVGPRIHAHLDAQGQLNLLRLLPEPSAEPAEPARWHIARLRIRDGLLDIRDFRVAPARSFTLTPWSFELLDIGTESANGLAELHGDLADGGRLDWTGKVTLQPFQSSGRLQVQNMALPELMRWIPDDIPVRVANGRLSVDLGYEAALEPTPNVKLIDSGIALDDLEVDAERRDLARLQSLRVNGIGLSWPEALWSVDSILVDGGSFLLERDSNGLFRLQKILASAPARRDVTPASKRESAGPAWKGSLKNARISDIMVRFRDASTRPLTEMTLGPLSVSTTPGRSNNQDTLALLLDTRLNETGSLRLDGLVGMPSPLPDGRAASPFFKGDLRLADVALNRLQGYITPLAHVRMQSGALGLQGQASWQAAGNPAWQWQGDIGLSDLQLQDSRSNTPLLRARALRANGLSVQGEPNRVRLQQLLLDQPFLRVVQQADGQINLATLARTAAAASPASAATTLTTADRTGTGNADWPVQVDAVVMRNGNVVIRDQAITPEFIFNLRRIDARLGNIRLPASQPVSIDLQAQLPPLGRIQVSGKAVADGAKPEMDLTLKASDLDLTSLSPYTGRYAGYRVEKGRLDAGLKYAISNRRLTAENDILLKGYTWGDKVESADATGLPVRLAVALLKDVNGNIDINLPLSGSLDDPQFKVWPLVWQTLGNLITRAAAAPFKMLASLAGGGSDEDVGQIGFAAGSSTLDATAQARVTKLAEALKSRPGLQLEVAGMADPTADAAAILAQRQAAGEKKPQLDGSELPRLAQARANQILSALITAGVPGEQIFRLDSGETSASNGVVNLALNVRVP